MALPDVLLRAVGSSTPTGINPLEALNEAPFSGKDGSSFSAVMAEVNAEARKFDENTSENGGFEAGKALPELPGRPLDRMQRRSISDTDQNLEEFAVGMGIDRELVRLLLSETAPVTAEADEAKIEARIGESLSGIANPMAVSTGSMELPPTPSAFTAKESSATTILNSTPKSGATATAGSWPIADEDLLLWRSSLSAASGSSTLVSTAGGDLAAPAIGATSIASPALALTAERLKAHAAPLSMPVGGALAVAAPPEMIETLDSISSIASAPTEATSSVALSEPSVWRSPRFNFVNDGALQSSSAPSAIEGSSKADAGGFTEFMDGRARSGGERSSDMSARALASPDIPVSIAVEASPNLPPTSMATALLGPLSSPTSISLTTGFSQSSATGETSMVLPTPDIKLTFGERVQAFADAVAQRVIGQIRDENWSVRLQLEPANLGAMDIDLSLNGNVVAATVSVLNHDVRALLESGLPRLRESLEAAGLQLSGWNFGQSGSRAFNDSARKFSQTAFRGKIDETGSVADFDASRMMATRTPASGKIDLFV